MKILVTHNVKQDFLNALKLVKYAVLQAPIDSSYTIAEFKHLELN